MDDEDLKSKLAEVLGRDFLATRQEQQNRERAKQWMRG